MAQNEGWQGIEWESVKKDGTIKRYPIRSGWIYGIWEWQLNKYGMESTWHLISTLYVPEPEPGKRTELQLRRDGIVEYATVDAFREDIINKFTGYLWKEHGDLLDPMTGIKQLRDIAEEFFHDRKLE